jgi:sigma-B regulation protein RsbU (phosphoserine phosphatase)
VTAISILHLEDNPLDAELIQASLEMGGFAPDITLVQTEQDYAAALNGSSFDLVLADYSLPSFDGLSALASLRKLGHDTPFIFVSGALGEELAIESLKNGATDYVLKQRLQRLPSAVDRALREFAEREDRRQAQLEKERLIGELAVAYEREHRIAETLQRSFLNAVEPDQFADVEVATIYQAAWDEAQVGGDYFDCFALKSGQITLVVGDVSGKGLNAAERTAELKYVFRAYMREHNDSTHAVTCLNEFLCDAHGLDPKDCDYFVVVSVAVVDPANGATEIIIAGAEPVVIVRADGRPEEVNASGLPLGIASGTPYSSVAAKLNANDILLMGTDGLTEARRDGGFLGLDGLIRIAVQSLAAPDLQTMGASILREAQDHAGGKLADDACLLLARLGSQRPVESDAVGNTQK